MDDGKCLFEASSFEAVPMPSVETAVWTYTAVETPVNLRPYPQLSKYDKRRERYKLARNTGRR